jgi:hypothetical protein
MELDIVTDMSMLKDTGLKDVNSAFKKYFSDEDCVVILAVPEAEAESLPSKQRILELFANQKQEEA